MEKNINYRDILSALFVNCIWGLAFVIPKYLTDVDPILVALGRYFVYGVLSGVFILATFTWRTTTLRWRDWGRAFIYALTGHVGYYAVLVLAISFGGVLVVAPIMAVLPISVAVLGNYFNQELHFKPLIFPLLLISGGILSLRIDQNIASASHATDSINVIYGGILAFIALALWTGYAVSNARYLKQSQISSVTWAQIMGICCLCQVILVAAIGLTVVERPHETLAWMIVPEKISAFIGGILILGILVSWYSSQIWNKVSRRLPITVAGQLLVVQSIAAIIYNSLLERHAPSTIEILCILLVITGVVWGVKVVYQSPKVR